MHPHAKQTAIIVGVATIVLLVAGLIATNLRSSNKVEPVTLTVWGVADEGNVFNPIAGGYTATHPHVTIQYQKIDAARYRDTVLNALAAGQGPDIFMISNHGLAREKDKITPAPQAVMNLTRLRELFPTVVEQDVADAQGNVYALPRSIDTLALFYNKDQFDGAGIASPPLTWDEFQKDVAALRATNSSGQLTIRGAALGSTDRTVNAGIDILQLLMLQSGTAFVNPSNGAADFSSQGVLSAFAFYLQFANPASSLYTWSDAEAPALEAFASKKVAMVFGYKSDVDAVRAKSPFLNFGIAPIPQRVGATEPVSVAKYWSYAVSKQSKAPAVAWDFITYLTTDPLATAGYVNSSLTPPALRSLVSQVVSDGSLGVFSRQALTARSWYQADDDKMQTALNAAIDRVLRGVQGPAESLRQAQDQVNQLR